MTRADAVQANLIDGLGSADVTQVGRPVGGADDEGHAREVGFDDSGVEVGGGRTGGADKRHRPAARAGEPEREEGGRTLVEVEPGADHILLREGDSEGGSSASRA